MLAATLLKAFLVAAAASTVVEGISVPTGKKTPITPPKPTERPAPPRLTRAPAPVVEYSQENPEPPPLDPSYTPPTYQYFDTLIRNGIYFIPMRLKVPSFNIQEQAPVKPLFRVAEYTRPSRPYKPQEEKKPDYHFAKKYQPFKETSFKQPYDYDVQLGKPTKGGYPKKAIGYHSKYFYQTN